MREKNEKMRQQLAPSVIPTTNTETKTKSERNTMPEESSPRKTEQRPQSIPVSNRRYKLER